MTFDYSRLAATCSVENPENAVTLPPEANGSDELVTLICDVHREDLDACAAVQRAIRSGVAGTGRLSHLGRPLWEFYRYLGRELGIIGNRADLASAG